MTPHSSRKSQRVYRSPSNPNEPSPFSKAIIKNETPLTKKIMEIDAEDAEAGTILMALKNHSFSTESSSTYDEKVNVYICFVQLCSTNIISSLIASKK